MSQVTTHKKNSLQGNCNCWKTKKYNYFTLFINLFAIKTLTLAKILENKLKKRCSQGMPQFRMV